MYLKLLQVWEKKNKKENKQKNKKKQKQNKNKSQCGPAFRQSKGEKFCRSILSWLLQMQYIYY